MGWLISYLMWAAAALHPSMRTLSEDRRNAGNAPVRPLRMILLTMSSLLAPLVLIQQGISRPEHVDWLAIGLAAGVLFVLVVGRMSGFLLKMQDQAKQLREQALHDDLTGLPNRRHLKQRLQAVLPAPLQLILIDLDDFKDVNDRLGHAVGDQLIAAVAGRLAALTRPVDFFARLGGDEFVMLLPDTSAEQADAVIAQVQAELRRPVPAGPYQLLVGASIGVADGDGTDDAFEPLRRADVARYVSKEGGNQPRRYHPGMDRQADENSRLAAEIRAALQERQFQVVYQPIVALPHGDLEAVEALVRWRHPERGLVSPAEFIPVAESNGLIVDLGAWVLRTACAQAVEWRTTLGVAAPSRMSVNVSARQLAEPGFAELVREVLTDTGLPPSCLSLEVTETAIFDSDRSVTTLLEIRRLGVRIALDDFGTGYSSLSLLQTVPVDILKVDKSFVDDITTPGRDTVIAAALIHVADGLGLTAVAEGVETAEQAAELYRLGYRYAQGYHFGRPVPGLHPHLVAGVNGTGRVTSRSS
jgi:diguanylate cyclase (GGDEF)-like protein